jgi:hypothetical protein
MTWLQSLAFVLLVASALPLVGQASDGRYQKADSIAALFASHSLDDPVVLALKLTASLSKDEDKFRSIYRWVCDNIAMDYALTNEYKREAHRFNDPSQSAWVSQYRATLFKTLYRKKRTTCTGYAYILRELALHAGLECVVIHGYGRNASINIGGLGIPNHSWNAVKLAGRWYQCDPAWSSGAIDAEKMTFIRRFNPAYFLPDAHLFALNHYPLDTAWLLSCRKPTKEQFLDAPLAYSSTALLKIEPLSPRKFAVQARRKDSVTFSFRSPARISLNDLRLQIGTAVTREKFRVVQDDDMNVYSVTRRFRSRGAYAVHLVMDGNVVVSYEVEVR